MALQAPPRIAERGSQTVLAAVAKALREDVSSVRLMAVRAIAAAAREGDPQAFIDPSDVASR